MKIEFNVKSVVLFNKGKKELLEKIKESMVGAKTIRNTSGDYVTRGYLDWLYLLGITSEVYEFSEEENDGGDIREMTKEECAKYENATGLITTGGPRLASIKLRERGEMYEIDMVAYSAPIIVSLSKLFPNVRFRVSDREESMFGFNCNVYSVPDFNLFRCYNSIIAIRCSG